MAERAFSHEKIQTIISFLPENCKIYGFDIGDFSNDGRSDVVLSVKASGYPSNTLQVFMLLNDGRSFLPVYRQFTRYFSLPIEIGFTIDQGVCYVTHKIADNHWRIDGWQVRRNCLQLVNSWETRLLNLKNNLFTLGYEYEDYFLQLREREAYFHRLGRKTYFENSYAVLPVYNKDRTLNPAVPREIVVDSAASICQGLSNWYGPDDLSYAIHAVYDSAFLTISISIQDDILVSIGEKDSVDRMELWFDVSGRRKLLFSPNGYAIRKKTDKGIFILGFTVDSSKSPYFFAEGKKLTQDQKEALTKARLRQWHDAMGRAHADLRIPMELFSAGKKKGKSGFGFVAAYHDVDQPDKPFRQTTLATSSNFESGNPSTFGKILFLEQGEWFGEFRDVLIHRLLNRLARIGVIVSGGSRP
ncbi:MAG: hypothetical protein GXO82_08105 [Chlorobi bacterium]|nr:hypothetical protein [Chlorobiota bacterium]